MRIYSLADLPTPDDGRRGWPWTEAPAPLQPTAPDGTSWPRISIVTPSFNQAQYLEETIRSVLLQGYPNLEYFVVDGGSSDGSAEILRRYDAFLDGWVSERDKGQSDAINKGLARCTGTLVNWLCSDDVLSPGALATVARTFVDQPHVDIVAGATKYQFDDRSQPDCVRSCSASDLAYLPAQNRVLQPSCFFRRLLLTRTPPVRADLHYLMDWELWCYFIAQKVRWAFVDDTLSVYRVTGTNKSFVGRDKMRAELDAVYREYCGEAIPLLFWMRNFWLPLHRRGGSTEYSVAKRGFALAARAVAFMLRIAYPKPRIQGLRMSFMWYEA